MFLDNYIYLANPKSQTTLMHSLNWGKCRGGRGQLDCTHPGGWLPPASLDTQEVNGQVRLCETESRANQASHRDEGNPSKQAKRIWSQAGLEALFQSGARVTWLKKTSTHRPATLGKLRLDREGTHFEIKMRWAANLPSNQLTTSTVITVHADQVLL
jgi:hypothetical protein